MAIKVTVWNENVHDKEEYVRAIHPNGIHNTVKDFLMRSNAGLPEDQQLIVRTATLDQPEQGFADGLLEDTDVLMWWGHMHHGEVSDELAERIVHRVWGGMGFIALHSAHMSKPFMRLMGTPCTLHWGDEKKEIMWTAMPSHEIAAGVPEHFELEEEMYGEPFMVPTPDELVFMSWFETGYVFRSGCCYKRGYGRVFYFEPGHESRPSYHNEHVQRILSNAARWAAPHFAIPHEIKCDWEPSLV